MCLGIRLICAASMAVAVWGQALKPYLSSERRALTAPELKDAPDEWIARSLQWAGDILDEYQPAVAEHPVRRAALIRLDDVLHIESAPRKKLVQEFYRSRMEKAVTEIEHAKVSSGMRIWKLYNHGWLVRTPSVSFAFDIVPGTREPGFAVDQGLLRRLAAQADALFISHMHGDHASQEVAAIFVEMKKPVVAPQGLWKETEVGKSLTYPERSTSQVHTLALSGGRSLKYAAYPGHQGKSPINNVHLVTAPEGLTVVQTGDQ
ncbi:MAG: MBL fold metallo-hydrolase, partial [Acidobacteria bacterium]|nr:MBL fold metallo-hydrolase [Acidobacteriota bacterium]